MHPNPVFRRADEARARQAAADRGFGTLVANGPDAPHVAQVPFVLAGERAEFHLLRSNPLARALPARAVLIVSGPDGYVSPDWYGVDDQVPTWNYVSIHLEGRVETLPADALRPHLDALSARFEARLDKRPWTSGKMTPGVMDRMMRSLIPARLTVEAVHSTFKLNQNKADAARLGAADAIGASVGHELDALAALMRAPPG